VSHLDREQVSIVTPVAWHQLACATMPVRLYSTLHQTRFNGKIGTKDTMYTASAKTLYSPVSSLLRLRQRPWSAQCSNNHTRGRAILDTAGSRARIGESRRVKGPLRAAIRLAFCIGAVGWIPAMLFCPGAWTLPVAMLAFTLRPPIVAAVSPFVTCFSMCLACDQPLVWVMLIIWMYRSIRAIEQVAGAGAGTAEHDARGSNV
jgi:hypothetical protein